MENNSKGGKIRTKIRSPSKELSSSHTPKSNLSETIKSNGNDNEIKHIFHPIPPNKENSSHKRFNPKNLRNSLSTTSSQEYFINIVDSSISYNDNTSSDSDDLSSVKLNQINSLNNSKTKSPRAHLFRKERAQSELKSIHLNLFLPPLQDTNPELGTNEMPKSPVEPKILFPYSPSPHIAKSSKDHISNTDKSAYSIQNSNDTVEDDMQLNLTSIVEDTNEPISTYVDDRISELEVVVDQMRNEISMLNNENMHLTRNYENLIMQEEKLLISENELAQEQRRSECFRTHLIGSLQTNEDLKALIAAKDKEIEYYKSVILSLSISD